MDRQGWIVSAIVFCLTLLLSTSIGHLLTSPSPPDRVKTEFVTWTNDYYFVKLEDFEFDDDLFMVANSIADSGSMEPCINADSNIIMFRPNSLADIRRGDIVWYTVEKEKDSFINKIHRVVEVNSDDTVTARGDHIWDLRDKVKFDNIGGVVACICY